MRNIHKTAAWLRSMMIEATGNVSLFFFAAFVVPELMYGMPVSFTPELADNMYKYLVLPWGAALCLQTIRRREEAKQQELRLDFCVMFVLLLWTIVPFWFRFGPTTSNIVSGYKYMILFFGLYATIVTEGMQQREHLLDMACALFAAFSFIYAGALLAAAWGNTKLGLQPTTFPFGIYNGDSLCAGMHYNATGLVGICCGLLSLIGFVRRKHLLAKAAHLIPGIMMILVVILTQSRTSRYALIVAFAAALYGYVASGFWHKSAWIRHMAGIMAAVVIVVGGYMAAAKITETALYRYALVDVQRKQQTQENSIPGTEDAASAVVKLIISSAKADETEGTASDEQVIVKPKDARGLGEMTFTGRTTIWRGALEVWKEKPLHFFIGKGAGRSYMELGKNVWGGEISAHNAYLQVILDYGLIGFVLLMAILCLAVPPAVRIFFARPDRAVPGGRLLCAVIVAGLVTGLMETEVFEVMRFTNLVFFYALAMLVAFGRDVVEQDGASVI